MIDAVRRKIDLQTGASLTSTNFRDIESTRLLCAAVSTDRALGARVIWEATQSSPRTRPPATDADMAVVTRWAILEKRRRTIRDGLLGVCLLLFLIGLFGSPAGSGFFFLLLVSLFLSWLVVLGVLLYEADDLVNSLSREKFDARSISRRLRTASGTVPETLTERPDVTIYSGYSPFVGSGEVIEAWSFSTDIAKGADEGKPPEEFSVEELREHVTRGLGELRWPELEISERLFVNGLDLVKGSVLLPNPHDRPVGTLTPEMFEAVASEAGDSLRRYTQVRVAGWDASLVYTLYLRFVLRPRSLFIEASGTVLTPVRDSVDLPERYAALTDGERFWRCVRVANQRTLPLLFASGLGLFRLWRAPAVAERRAQRDRRLITRGLPFDYGAGRTVREQFADPNYPRYFQQLDKEMYSKVVQARVLDLIVDFLDEKGVDTESLVSRQTTILNSGVMVTGGGSLSSDNIAVGKEAKITDQRIMRGRGRGNRGGGSSDS